MSEELTESQLIQNAMNGNLEAFGELVRLYQRPVYNLAYRMLGESGEAEDAAQEAFMRAYTHLNRYDPGRSFKTWILSITSNYCIDRLRKRRLIWLSIDEPLPPHPALVSTQATPEQAAIAGELSASVQELLNKLSPEYRTVVVLRYWYDLSYAEIAAMLKTSESAIKSRLFRARQALAKELDAETASEFIAALEKNL